MQCNLTNANSLSLLSARRVEIQTQIEQLDLLKKVSDNQEEKAEISQTIKRKLEELTRTEEEYYGEKESARLVAPSSTLSPLSTPCIDAPPPQYSSPARSPHPVSTLLSPI